MKLKKIENFKQNDIAELTLIQGGKRVPTNGTDDGYCTRDVQKYDRDGKLKWEKFYWD